MNTIIIHSGGNDYNLQYNHNFTIINLYNDFFQSFQPCHFIVLSSGLTITRNRIIQVIQAKLQANIHNN